MNMAGILIIGEHRQGELRPVTLELITAAEGIRAGAGGALTLALIGKQLDGFVAQASLGGLDQIVKVEAAHDEFEPDLYAVAVKALIDAMQPAVVLLPHSVNSLGYAAALAAANAYGLATDVHGLSYDGITLVATRSGYSQKVNVELDFPGKATVLLAVRGGSFKPPASAASPAISTQPAPQYRARVRHLGYVAPESVDTVNIPGAEFIMSIGRGVGEETNVEEYAELAESIGATLGCSRPIADAGWLPKARQVGQSGQTAAACKLYVAFGISGSVQHLAGMKHVDTIIAINTDREASIFSYARYGIVGDMFKIAEELRNHF
jgi:electron transfer flavoprotein alpha subunit